MGLVIVDSSVGEKTSLNIETNSVNSWSVVGFLLRRSLMHVMSMPTWGKSSPSCGMGVVLLVLVVVLVDCFWRSSFDGAIVPASIISDAWWLTLNSTLVDVLDA